MKRNSSDVEYDTYQLAATNAPGEAESRCNERLGKLSSAEGGNFKPAAEGSDSDSVASGCAVRGARSARELLADAVAKLTRCTDVLSNLVDRVDLNEMEGVVEPNKPKQKTVCAYAWDI